MATFLLTDKTSFFLVHDFFFLQQEYFSYCKKKILVPRKKILGQEKKCFVTLSRGIFLASEKKYVSGVLLG